jgi:putative sterol carrier protein
VFDAVSQLRLHATRNTHHVVTQCKSADEEAIVSEVISVKPIFEAMPVGLNKETSKDANVVYQFNLSGEGGGQFTVSIQHGTCTVKEGAAENPDVTVSASAADYLNIVTGAYPFGLAFINGRLKVEGDLRLLIRMGSYFTPQS